MKMPRLILFIRALLIVAALAIAAMLNSCRFSRNVQKKKSDSTSVNKRDSGRVQTSSSSETNAGTWWRETFLQIDSANKSNSGTAPVYLPGKSENHYITQPTLVIREGGTYQQVKVATNYDSLWYKTLDSLRRANENKTVDTKGDLFQFLKPVLIWAMCLITIIVIMVVFLRLKK